MNEAVTPGLTPGAWLLSLDHAMFTMSGMNLKMYQSKLERRNSNDQIAMIKIDQNNQMERSITDKQIQ